MLKIIKNVKLKMSILFKERWRFRIHVHWTVADGYMYDMTVNVLFSKVDLFSAQENFCTNLNGEKSPWCFTTDPNYLMDICDAPSYGKMKFIPQ